ncbi:efflux RND transporter periplasmic adaptor subunit [Christensenella hongkongensis]|uniref:Putative Co/Zn/Cd efflux system membrane fusion protein n=2 Tax=Christensenella hongkongensis TaxID=270498 RepID=A0A0M2NJ47_9FIRM|nr:HlyD family efflux transporter periplasmic adaptor subunit [Christensenella hongkongensis]KKI52193.1 putative Co/Zn/Cd efflux system membrane fusion protein [Christensenella hongkongensis]KUJ29602.1 hypothetical protein AR437_08435 [Christensenella hongkongensis]TCW28556.1 HlyD family secretion protein [Christensenella hongkongensis]
MNKKRQKSKKKKWIIISAVTAAVVLLAVFLLPQFMRGNTQAAGALTKTATVSTGTIETTVVGSGNLESSTTTDVKIPAGVTVDSVLVEAGDTVKAGDTLATLEPASLQSAVLSAQEKLSSIDSEISSTKDDTESKYITSSVSGRVKQIYASENTSTYDVITQNGSLLVLSIDGKMKTTFTPATTEGVSYGDSVTVTLSDGSTVTGTVSVLSSSSCTVTLTDNGPSLGDTVSISSEDGTVLGSGTLEINTPLEILGGSGVVSSVDVSLNESVSSGDTLITLQEAAASAEYESLLAERVQYEELLRLLVKYSATNSIVADIDGSISAVSISGSTSTDSSSSGSSSQSAATGAQAMKTSSLLSTDQDETNDVSLLSAAAEDSSDSIMLLADTQVTSVMPISGVVEIFINNPVEQNTPQTTIMPGVGYTGKITWTPSEPKFSSGTAYMATVTLTATSGYHFENDAQVNVSGAQVQNIVVSGESEGNTLTFDAVFPATAEGTQTENSVEAPSAASGTETSGSGSMPGGNTGSSGMSASSSGSSSSVAATSAATSSSTSDSDDSLTSTAFTISTGTADTLSVDIDELDILSIEDGQTATVVLDALPDQVFEGTVTKISDAGTAQSGVTTYPVTITLADTAASGIKAGMNATATISIATSENVLLIPLDALQESAEGQFVYIAGGTSEEGLLGERRTVETGLSDGTNVEITSGLSEGEQVVYTDTSSTESSVNTMFQGGMGGGMPGGSSDMGSAMGEPPSGGNGGGPGSAPGN